MPSTSGKGSFRNTMAKMIYEYGAGAPIDYHNVADQILDELKKRLPKEIDDGDGWDIFFGQSDTKDINGKVIKKGKARSCCPGDDIAYAHNEALKAVRKALFGSDDPL